LFNLNHVAEVIFLKKLNFRLTAVSPWFLYGADPRGIPELRAASVRGQLRYWLRAILGAQNLGLAALWQAESAIFGSAEGGSTVAIRVFGKAPTLTKAYMLPHRAEEHRRAKADAIPIGYSAALEVVTRFGVTLPSDAWSALKVWSLLGGIGKRSRRMFGGVDLSLRQGTEWYAASASPEALMINVQDTLNMAIKAHGGMAKPSFPTLHPDHSWVMVGTKTYSDPEQANIDLFRDLLRIPYFRAHEQTFGQAMNGRRSSPLIAQLRQVGDDVVPVLTVMRSTPDQNIDWAHMKALMTAAETYFDGKTVWGGW